MRTWLFSLFIVPALVATSLGVASRDANGGPRSADQGNTEQGSAIKGAAKSRKKVYVCPPCGLDCDKETHDKPGVCPHCGMTLVEKTSESPVSQEKSLTVAILVFNGVEIIDYSGPWEVFGAAGFKVHTVASGPGPIKTVFGEKLIPDYTLENSPQADIVLVPGGSIAAAMNDARVIEWIQTRSKQAKHVMSVCNGAFLLARAGLLDGLSATTVRGGIDRLARVAPRTKVVRNQRYVDNGKFITTAGLSAGIDGAMHLVAKTLGKGAAEAVAYGLEYRWDGEPM
jgi:putative intracellular protease/amidase/DNA-directed RNA polymerase subunit RPC12/RpoP